MIYAYPTEGVWGLGCLPDSEEDVKKICFLKQRTLDKGLILVSGHFSHFDPYLSHLSVDLINKTHSGLLKSRNILKDLQEIKDCQEKILNVSVKTKKLLDQIHLFLLLI